MTVTGLEKPNFDFNFSEAGRYVVDHNLLWQVSIIILRGVQRALRLRDQGLCLDEHCLGLENHVCALLVETLVWS